MKLVNSSLAGILVIGLAASATACANTVRGVVKDTANVAEKVSEGTQTGDVKTALIADDQVDTSTINVDTYGDKRTVVLRGSVPTAAMKERAEMIARREAPGYKIENQLAVVAR